MLNFPAQRSKPRQHIIPLYAKYIAIWTIIIFAAASSYFPEPRSFKASANYRRDISVFSPQKAEAIAVSNAPIKKRTSIKIVQSSHDGSATVKTTVIQETEEKVTPTPIKSGITPTNTPTPTPSQKPTQSEKREQIADMSTPTPTKISTPQVNTNPNTSDARQQLFQALNSYRQKKGKSPLSWDDKLASFAEGRAEKFDHDGKMDSHAGFQDMINNDGFSQMGFRALAENSSYGDTRDPMYIIETLYGNSPGHDANQLNSEYTHVGVGASGKATDFVFGGRKI